jgi:type III secretion system HrpB7-like protein
MTTGSAKVWDTVLLMKNRALKRLEKNLAAQREELKQCRAEVLRKNDAVSACRDDSTRHARRLDELMRGAAGFSPQQYLDHDSYRKLLVERTDMAVAEVTAAEQRVMDKQNEIADTNSKIGKATTKRDLIKKRIEMLKNQKDLDEQNNQDEEAAETNLARHILAVKAANLQRMTR